MKSIENYLENNFIIERDFVEISDISILDLIVWQEHKIFPRPSYTSETEFCVNSFFGPHKITNQRSWYCKGLLEWIPQIRSCNYDSIEIKNSFLNRYMDEIVELGNLGLQASIFQNSMTSRKHLDDVWNDFLKGYYGVCTKTSSPEQIAAKNLTTTIIDNITKKQSKCSISRDDELILMLAVNILDECSSNFSPHERAISSRSRCIDLVRSKYFQKN
ncbi:TPA: hypothetical protein SLN52_000692 [Serratia marcescens]|nr:hypothetical protein [Serratia marcescens]